MSLKAKLAAITRIIKTPKAIKPMATVAPPGASAPAMGPDTMLDDSNKHITDLDKQEHQMKILRKMMKGK